MKTQVSNFEMMLGRLRSTKRRNCPGEGSYRRRQGKRRLRSPERNKVNKFERKFFERRIVCAEVLWQNPRFSWGFPVMAAGLESPTFTLLNFWKFVVCSLYFWCPNLTLCQTFFDDFWFFGDSGLTCYITYGVKLESESELGAGTWVQTSRILWDPTS